MGIIPVPEIPGNDCICWPADHTPNLVKAFFGGIEIGGLWHAGLPSPPNGYHDLAQSPMVHCEFHIGAPATYRVTYRSAFGFPALANLTCQVAVGEWAFRTAVVPSCTRFFTNSNLNPFNNHYINGWGFICTPAEMAEWIELVTPITGPDPRMELFPMEDGEIVLRFASIQDGTNIEIKVDTALL